MKNQGLILASQSPRRADLLSQVGITFRKVASGFDETTVVKCSPKEFVKTLALKKAESLLCMHYPERYILSADTVVVYENRIMGKPTSSKEAFEFLSLLSAHDHFVYTGVCVYDQEQERYLLDVEETRVTMDCIDAPLMAYYVGTKEPFDKAGAYGIQGIGARFIRHIDGDYYNVVGLPLNMTLKMLEALGFHTFR